MKPPKRIYLQWYGRGGPDDSGEIDESDVSWCANRCFKHDIVYVRRTRLPVSRQRKDQLRPD